MVILVISVLFSLLVFSPYIAGIMQQIQGTTFTGSVHYLLDYYYYLSYMAQGSTRWLTSINIHTTEVKTPVFYHWMYVLSGHVFRMFGISNIVGYQVLILLLSLLLLVLSYRLIRKAVPSYPGAIVAFILFLTSNAFPYVSRTSHGWGFRYYTSWYNFGEPFIRFSSIPHHLLAQSLLILSLLLLTDLHRIITARYLRTWFLLVLCGFLLANTQTPLVLVILLTYGIMWTSEIIASRNPKKFIYTAFSSPLFPALILLLVGAAPYMVYLRMLFQHLPYSTVISWEATQQIHISIIQFLRINGPVVLLGIIGIPLFLYTRTKASIIITLCTFISWGIFLSPIPSYITILNVRFLSVIPTLTMACSAAVLIETLLKRLGSRRPAALRIGILSCIIAVTLPASFQQIIARSTFDPHNAYLFLPDTVMDAYKHVEKLITPQETCFVVWPFNVSFAGLTGRRAFISNGFSTINYQSKELIQNTFFSDQTTLTKKSQILTTNGITCVVTYSFTTHLPPTVNPVYTNGYMTIYKVKR